jgi:hypothetical protein
MREAKLVIVQAFGDQWEAQLAKSALEAAGIDSAIQADSVGSTRPHVAFVTGGYKLLVREEDAAAAHDVLDPPGKGA